MLVDCVDTRPRMGDRLVVVSNPAPCVVLATEFDIFGRRDSPNATAAVQFCELGGRIEPRSPRAAPATGLHTLSGRANT